MTSTGGRIGRIIGGSITPVERRQSGGGHLVSVPGHFQPNGVRMTLIDSPGSDTASTDIALSRRCREVAMAAACAVQGPLIDVFRSRMEVDTKVDFHDIVTIHDKATEERLTKFILRELPDSAILGEEGGATGSGAIQWYVDPIDGTANFARGLAFWCISIGAVVDGEIVAGAILDPIAGQMFSADVTGAWLGDAPLRSRAATHEREAVLITGYPVARDLRLDGREVALENFGRFAETFSTLRRPGSAALSIAHVAAGWADAAAGFGVNPWDVAAAILILKQARGSYHPLSLGKVDRASRDYLCPGYIALGEGADYPTLMSIAQGISARRDVARL